MKSTIFFLAFCFSICAQAQSGVYTPPPVGTPPMVIGKGVVMTSCQNMPQFPGGPDSLNQFLRHHLKTVAPCAPGQQNSTVHVLFVNEMDGSVTGLTPFNLADADIAKALNGCMSPSPKWSPGLEDGVPVRVFCDMYLPACGF
jgi:hypothetical protein